MRAVSIIFILAESGLIVGPMAGVLHAQDARDGSPQTREGMVRQHGDMDHGGLNIVRRLQLEPRTCAQMKDASFSRKRVFRHPEFSRRRTTREFLALSDPSYIHLDVSLGSDAVLKGTYLPVLLRYASFFGSSGGEGSASAHWLSQGDVIITGVTESLDLPARIPDIQQNFMGYYDGLIARFRNDTFSPVYSQFIGGTNYDHIRCSEPGPQDELVFAGLTESANFPVTLGAFSTKYAGGTQDGFIAKIDSSGRRLLFSTFIGGRGWDDIFDMKRGPDGSIYAVGATDSYSSFPRSPDALQRSYGGGDDDMFIVVLDSSGRHLKYGSFFGGNGFDEANSLSIAPNGDVVIGGMTSSSNLSTSVDALQDRLRGQEDGFLLILDSTLTRIRYASYLGGSKNDAIVRVLYHEGDLYGCGHTTSRDLSATPGVVQERKSEPNGPNESIDSFVFRFDMTDYGLRFLTYLGGEADDEIEDISRVSDVIVLGGVTTSSRFPCTDNAVRKVKTGYFDGMLTIMDTTGVQSLFSTYVGGGNGDGIYTVLADQSSDVLLCTGFTTSTDFPITTDAAQSAHGGDNDVLLLAFSLRDLLNDITDTGTKTNPKNFGIGSVSPHPFGESGFTVAFLTPANQRSNVTLFDVLGRRVGERVVDGGSALRSTRFDGNALAPGAYLLVLEAGGERVARMVVKGW